MGPVNTSTQTFSDTGKRFRVYIDMDGVLCDIKSGFEKAKNANPEIKFPQSIVGIFEGLEPMPGAIAAVNSLRANDLLDVWILSAPSVRNPHCYAEKRIWIENHFGYDFAKRLILATDKSLLKGDVLIDDYAEGKGQDRFGGTLIQFGTPSCPDWRAALATVSLLLAKASAPSDQNAKD